MGKLVLDSPPDQAIGRSGSGQFPVQVITVASGKGGIGKTNLSINLSIALAKRGRDVMLMDADLGLANVHVLMGLQPKFNLAHLIAGECRLEDMIVQGPSGVRVVPASSGVQRMTELTKEEAKIITCAFAEVSYPTEVLIVDVSAGISDNVIRFICSADEVVITVCDEPTSITDAYALIKVLFRDHGLSRFRIVTNMTRKPSQGLELFEKLQRVTEGFLKLKLDYLGSVPFDPDLVEAVQRQSPVVVAFPESASAKAFMKIAQKVDVWPLPIWTSGKLGFFMERLNGYLQ